MTIYVLLRVVGVPFQKVRKILESLNLIGIQECHRWCLTIIEEDDLCVVLRDKRGGYKSILFYEEFPDIEVDAKAYAISGIFDQRKRYNESIYRVYI